ncbi:MAG: HD domain-containing protein [Candidatus Pacebacteria bacterium]|nr:HD domain-containing protein [Candidatus Paceibacterota bacterium]
MLYTEKILKAIKFSAKTHNHYQQQLRTGKKIPYITHPLTVGIILSLAKSPEDTIIAGILHDTIEDSAPDYKVTAEMITERFGKNVSDLVLSVTEQDRKLSWDDRRKEALDHISNFSNDSVLVKSADIISNVSEIYDDSCKKSDKIFERFAVSKEKTLESYRKIADALLLKWPTSPLSDDLKDILNKIEIMKNK